MQTKIVAEITVTTTEDFTNMSEEEKLAFIAKWQDNRIVINITNIK